MESNLSRRVLAEGLGTALLVLFGPGAVVAALTVGGGSLDYAGLGFISLAFAVVVALVIYALGPVSGAHINPAVTFALAVTGRFAWREVVPYVAGQLVGAAAGALLVVATFGRSAVDLGMGMTSVADGVGLGQAVVIEALATFLLMLTIMAVAVDSRAPLGWAGFLIGLSVACAILLVAPQTGGSLNPARTFGPYLATTLFGGEAAWADFPVYWIGPLAGAALAAVVYDVLARTRAVQQAAEETYTPAETATPDSTLHQPEREDT